MLVATCNVNGLRAAVRKGMSGWLESTRPDVLLLQEVRAPEELVPTLIGSGYQIVQHASRIAGRAGVAVCVLESLPIGEVRIGLDAGLAPGAPEPDVDTGRWVEVNVPDLGTTFVSAYLHSGVANDAAKMEAKYSHLTRVESRLRELLQGTQAGAAPAPETARHVIVAGDFNIVHTERDIKNWKSNHNKTAGVLDDEIAYLDRWINDLGWVDVQRRLAGDIQGPYSWWSQRGKAFDNDAGWRLDYQLADPELAQGAVSARVERASSY
ncbi:MAG: exodeoxyribonuclease III, partial [Actinomycetaceae bacterium]|nr:exodeoxyribonuclease III [Actinomycetaceae bacterium]